MTAPRFSVVIPVYNERGTIEKLLAACGPCRSTRRSSSSTTAPPTAPASVLARLDAPTAPCASFLQDQQPRQGRRAAPRLRRGAPATSSSSRTPTSSTTRGDYPGLLEPILEGEADVVFGSRFLGGPHRVLYFWHYVGNRLLTLLSNMLHQPEPHRHGDLLQGLPRARCCAGITLESDRFGFEPEITAKVARAAARASTRCRSPITGARTRRARRSPGRTASAACGAPCATGCSARLSP